MCGTDTAPRPARGWLWLAVAGCCLLAVLVGFILRAAAHGGGASVLMLGAAGAFAVLLLIAEVVAALQAVQAREASAAALAGLPAGFVVSGRVRIRGHGRPVVADHVVVAPDGRAWAVTVDGATRSPRPGDAADGLRTLLPAAKRAAEAVQRAAAARVLPPQMGLAPGTAVRPCILVARRPFATTAHEGVLAFPAAEAIPALLGRA